MRKKRQQIQYPALNHDPLEDEPIMQIFLETGW